MNRLVPPLMALLLLLACVAVADAPLPTDPMAIRQELRALRKKTADGDPAARARIDALLQQLHRLQAQREAAESKARGEEKPAEEEDKAVLTREKMLEKVGEIAAKGKGAAADLAEPVRQAIIEEYEEDRDRSIKNPAYFQALTLLVIDLSSKQAPRLIEQLERFTSVDTLVLTGGARGAPVDLPAILRKAQKLPLTELHIVNFRGFLAAIPESIGTFAGLTKLSLFNNQIRRLPATVGKMKRLQVLHIDMNPIDSVLPVVQGLAQLRELGLGKTGVTVAEQAQIARLLPSCRIVTQ